MDEGSPTVRLTLVKASRSFISLFVAVYVGDTWHLKRVHPPSLTRTSVLSWVVKFIVARAIGVTRRFARRYGPHTAWLMSRLFKPKNPWVRLSPLSPVHYHGEGSLFHGTHFCVDLAAVSPTRSLGTPGESWLGMDSCVAQQRRTSAPPVSVVITNTICSAPEACAKGHAFTPSLRARNGSMQRRQGRLEDVS